MAGIVYQLWEFAHCHSVISKTTRFNRKEAYQAWNACFVFLYHICAKHFSPRQTRNDLRLRHAQKGAQIFKSNFRWNMSTRFNNTPPPLLKSRVNPSDSQLVTCGRTEMMMDMRLSQRWLWRVSQPKFRRNMSPPSAGSKNKSSTKRASKQVATSLKSYTDWIAFMTGSINP
jgi:hypothetical protein